MARGNIQPVRPDKAFAEAPSKEIQSYKALRSVQKDTEELRAEDGSGITIDTRNIVAVAAR